MSGGNAKPDRYVPVRELGEGGAGRVQLVEDRLRPGATLALKELAEHSRGREEGLRREFATLALLRHPNLVEVHDLDVAPETGLPRFTLEFIDGEDFVAAVRREGPAALPVLTAEVLRALSFLHDFGLIHRDLKPANVLVRRRPRLGCRAVVLDFGLALRGGSEGEGDPTTDSTAGTLPYLAPELFEGERADRRSDLYSVGALVYEAAHGSPAFPIEGKDLARFVEAVREGRRARPPLPEGFPPLLSAWLEELLSPDPSARPGDAIEALARLNAACGTSYPTEIPATRAARLGSGPLPGRDNELNALWGHLDEMEGPRLVWLCGGAGSGKSRVLRYLSGKAVARGWDVVTPPPGLEVPAAEGASGVEEDVAATLADLRARAASRPTLLLVDQVESAPDRSVRLLERIARERKGAPLRVVAAVRAAELRHPGARKLLDDLGIVPTLRRLDLEPLETEGIRAMASRATGGASVSESRVKWLLRNSEGNPLVAESLLVEGEWEQRGRRKTHTSLAESVTLRLAMLSSEALEWLRALCVLGDGVAAGAVAGLAGLDDTAARAASEEASAAGLARERVGRWSADSRLVAEQVLDNISVDRQRELYSQAAESLVGTGEPDPWRLAHLWSGAGEADQAVRQAVVAAEISLGRKDPAEAAQRLGYALRQLDRGDPKRRDLRMRQGAAFLDAERYEPAIRAYGSAVRLSRTRPDRADALGRQAHALALAGRFRRAEATANEAVKISRELGLTLEEARGKRVLGILLGRAGQLQEAYELFQEVLPIFEEKGDIFAHAETLHGLGSSGRMLRKADSGSVTEQAISAFTKLGLTAKALKSRLLFAPVHVEANKVADTVGLLREIRDAAEAQGHLNVAALALGRLSSLANVRGEFDRAITLAKEAEDQLCHMGDINGVVRERIGWAEALIEIGRPSEAVGLLRRSLDLPRDRVELARLIYIRLVLVDALRETNGPDDPEIKSLLAQVATESKVAQLSRAHLLALASEMLRRSEPMADDSFELVRAEFEALLRRQPHPLDPEVYFRSEMACANYYLNEGRLEEAMGAATTALDHVTRADFLSYVLRAQVVRAEVYERMGAEADLSRCLAAGRAVLKEAAERVSDPDARKDFLARPVFRRLRETSESPSAPERRLDALYDMIAVLNSETDPEALLESILEMALKVVEAERGMILLRDEKTDSFAVRLARNLDEETVIDVEAFSQNIVSQAGAGESILALDAGNDERFRDLKSVSLHKIRSLMCVPLRSRGRIIGTVYLDSRRKGRLFTKDDLGFVEAFANHAALALENAQARARLEAENRRLLSVAGERARFDSIIGRCPAMQKVFDLIETMAQSELPLLVQGESGTGKELVARAIHFHGPRKRKIILSENSAAIPETLLESALFGHVRGAFTGAERDRSGLFEQADGGTLFLDEVGDMSAAMQARLLRVLQEGELRRVGGEHPIHVDVRVIAATNKDLPTLVEDGRFREDLLYRLQVLAIQLPPLRDRPGDIPLLVDHLLERISRERGRDTPRIAGEVMDLLETYPWPGNVRQLESALQRLVLLAREGDITLAAVEADTTLRDALLGSSRRDPVYSLERSEQEQIERALEASGGNRNKAARMLGISRATIYRKIKEYGLS